MATFIVRPFKVMVHLLSNIGDAMWAAMVSLAIPPSPTTSV